MTTTPVEEARGRLIARLIVWMLAVVAVATFVFGWYVVSGQRRVAAETDRRLRTLAWATLAYANANHQFPRDDEMIVSFGIGPETLPASGTHVPTRREDALRGDAPADPREALSSIIVVWDRDPAKAPQFLSNRLPTRKGTLEEVALWMREMQATLDQP